MISKNPTPQPVSTREFVYRGNAVAAGRVITKLGGKPLAQSECDQHARRELLAPDRRSVAMERSTGASASEVRRLYRLPDIRVGTARRRFDGDEFSASVAEWRSPRRPATAITSRMSLRSRSRRRISSSRWSRPTRNGAAFDL